MAISLNINFHKYIAFTREEMFQISLPTLQQWSQEHSPAFMKKR